jgi:hypothetical protein
MQTYYQFERDHTPELRKTAPQYDYIDMLT